MADKKLPEKAPEGAPDPIPAGQGRARPITRRAAAIPPEDRADRTKTKPEDAYTDIVADGPGLPGIEPIGRQFVSARPSALPTDSPAKKFKGRRHPGTGDVPRGFKGHTSTAQPVERTRKEVAKTHQLIGAAERGYSIGVEALDRVLASDESINSAKLQADARQTLQRSLEQMDDAERKQTIAALMAYIGQLQASGVLESVPSARLARVAKLIGQAAEVVAADQSSPVPTFKVRGRNRDTGRLPTDITLYAYREPDPISGKLPTAIEWFERHWKPLVEQNGITAPELKSFDPKFYNALASAQTRAAASLGDLIPLRRKRLANMPPDELEARRARIRTQGTEAKRRQRSKATPG